MKYILPVLLLLFTGFGLKGQTLTEAKDGTVSYVTSQNVYVKFQSTENILVGDTLFISQASKFMPVLIVKELSSISCVCIPISAKPLSVNDKVSTSQKLLPSKNTNVPVVQSVIQPTVVVKKDSVSGKQELPAQLKQNISGRISVSSYSDFSKVTDASKGSGYSQRLRYNFSIDARNLGDSKLSGEAYISFAHRINEWSTVKNDIFSALKIYSLALNYAFNKNNTVWLGRKMNPRLSSMGSIDGLQYETKFKSFTAGLVAGTRPDFMNYSFNSKLLQYGGYLGHDYHSSNGIMQTTMAFVEQMNNGNTDRRFAYFQHSNSLIPNLYFFGSVEMDLFNKLLIDSTLTQNNKPVLSNFYVSLRYKVIKQLSLSLSYSERQNVIYYETYKSIVDQLLEAATMKGYMFQVSIHPIKKLSLGANAGYRFSKQDPKPSKNLYSYITYSNVPWLGVSATISVTFMETSYINGKIYSLGISRDLIPGKLSGGLSYRYVDYKFVNGESSLIQKMAELDLTWRLSKKLSFSFDAEGTFEKSRNYNRVYINLTQRF